MKPQVMEARCSVQQIANTCGVAAALHRNFGILCGVAKKSTPSERAVADPDPPIH